MPLLEEYMELKDENYELNFVCVSLQESLDIHPLMHLSTALPAH
jgi:hypothetical protein